jgi:hypothetical protein
MKPKDLPLAVTQQIDPGTGASVLCVVIDGDTALFDSGALHGTSSVEVGVEFGNDKPTTNNTRLVSVIWVGVRAGSSDIDGYYSVVANTVYIDGTRGVGWRSDAHFTNLITAIRGEIQIETMSGTQISQLRTALRTHDMGMWDHRSEPLRALWPD